MAEIVGFTPNDTYRFYVYAYLREDRSPYYIGKGTGDRAARNGGRPVYKPNDESRIIYLQTNLKEEDAYNMERGYIALYGRKTDEGPRIGILRNISDGGQGLSSKEGKLLNKKQLEDGKHVSQIPGYMKELSKKQFEKGKHSSQRPGHMEKMSKIASEMFRGENSTTNKLKEYQVISIFWDTRTHTEMARQYKINESSIRKIRKAISWKHLTLDLIEQKKRLISENNY